MTMLDRMRRHKNILKWTLALVVLTFVLLYVPDFLQNNPLGAGAAPREVVAEVGNVQLKAGDFQQRYLAQVNAYRAQFGGSINSQLLRQLGVEQQVLRQMIEEEIAIKEASRNGIVVSDDELAQQIFSLPGLQENGRFIGEARYEQLLQSQTPPMTKSQFEESLRRSMVLDKLRAAITDWMAISDADVEKEYRQRNEKVKLQVVALTADAFRDKVTVTDADVAAHYNAHSAEYRMGEQRKIKYLLLDREQARLKVAVPPNDIQRYYNDNLQQFQTPEQVRASHILLETAGKNDADVKKRAEDILNQAKGGADFAELAKKYSEDKGSKASGGDLDYFGRGRMVPEFEKTAFEMMPGQISDLVKSQFGYHIIKVTDKRPASTRTLDEVRPQIQQQLAIEVADQRITDQARALEKRIKGPADLAAVAKEAGLTVQESGLFQRNDPVPGLGAAPDVAAEAFRLESGKVSSPIATARGPVFITVSEKKDPYVPKLDEVKSRVHDDLVHLRATEMSRQRATAIAGALKSAASNFAAAAKAQGLEAKDTDLLARGTAIPDVGVSPEIDKVVYTLPVGAVTDPIRTPEGTVIVRVVEREDVTPEKLRQAREAFRAELLNERRGRFFNAYMNKAREGVKIEVNDDVLRRLTTASRS
ncbi:MAG TPA: peptidyl-prolyl cis-trans isomerase [Vicinamibacterales bacterium]|jgi:peptidyl-prolyl cis-trans isomerase D